MNVLDWQCFFLLPSPSSSSSSLSLVLSFLVLIFSPSSPLPQPKKTAAGQIIPGSPLLIIPADD